MNISNKYIKIKLSINTWDMDSDENDYNFYMGWTHEYKRKKSEGNLDLINCTYLMI